MTMPDDFTPPSPALPVGTETMETPSGETRSGARAQIRDVKDQVVGEAKNSFRQARDSASSSLSQSRQQAAERIGGLAGAMRSTSDHLRSENQPGAANLTESLADQVERLSSYLRDRDLRGFRTDLENLARQRPAVVIGAALGLGILARDSSRARRRPEVPMAGPRGRTAEERTLGELFGELSQDVALLVRQEARLAKTEMQQKLSNVTTDLVSLATGGVVALVGGLALTAALILLLIDPVGLKPWLAALRGGSGAGGGRVGHAAARDQGPQTDRPDTSADRGDHQGRHPMGEGAAAMSEFENQNEREVSGERSPKEIEHDIQRTRERMSSNIDELGDRLSPENLKQQAKEAIAEKAQDVVAGVGDQARETGSRMLDFITQNPLPVAAVSLGAIWLFGLRKGSRSEVSGDRMARFAYTGPERREPNGRPGSGLARRVADRAESMRHSVSDAVSEAGGKAGQIKEQVQERAGELGDAARGGFDRTVRENPLALLAGPRSLASRSACCCRRASRRTASWGPNGTSSWAASRTRPTGSRRWRSRPAATCRTPCVTSCRRKGPSSRAPSRMHPRR